MLWISSKQKKKSLSGAKHKQRDVPVVLSAVTLRDCRQIVADPGGVSCQAQNRGVPGRQQTEKEQEDLQQKQGKRLSVVSFCCFHKYLQKAFLGCKKYVWT